MLRLCLSSVVPFLPPGANRSAHVGAPAEQGCSLAMGALIISFIDIQRGVRKPTDADLSLTQARSRDVVRRLHAHERVHFYSEGFFDAQRHVAGERRFAIQQARQRRAGNL